mgnify:CR=1 FL=1
MTKKLACAVCGEGVWADCEHVELSADFVPDDQRPQMYYCHRKCLSELNDPEDFSTDRDDDQIIQ